MPKGPKMESAEARLQENVKKMTDALDREYMRKIKVTICPKIPIILSKWSSMTSIYKNHHC